MFKKQFAVLTLTAAAFVATPIVSSAVPVAPQDNRDNGDHRNDNRDNQQNDHHDNQGNHRDADYHFRSQDAQRLRENYRNMDHVDRNHRARYSRGERLPDGWRGRMEPVPTTVIRELPPPPPGDRFGYIDGYAVAYNPTTQIIADVLDLATVAANRR